MIAQFGMCRNYFSQSLNFERKEEVMSNENSSKLLHLIFIQPPVIGSPGEEEEAMVHAVREYGRKGIIVNNTYEMVGRTISECIHYKQLIGELTLVGHGSNSALHIGADRVTVSALTPGHDYYKPQVHLPIMQLIPYFHPSAKIEIQQCKCANSDEGKDLLKKLSQLWKRPVIGFSGDITFGRGVEYDKDGQFTVCVNELCLTHH